MRTIPLLFSIGVLGLWGCASGSGAQRDSLGAAYRAPLNEKDLAELSRMGAPTVYNGEATGGPGFSVTTGDGRLWAPEEAPGDTVVRTPSDVSRSLARHDVRSKVIDEGPTNKAPRS